MEELPRKKINLFFKDKFNVIGLIIILILNLIIWAILYFNIEPTIDPIPLHYNIYFGIDLIGQWYQIFYLPASGLIIYFINFVLSYIIYKREKIISYFLILSTGLIQIILIGAGLLIIQQQI